MIGRLSAELVWAAGALGVAALRERRRAIPPEQSALPRKLRMTLERLGPTFMKAGQALSLRQDLLPQPYLAELAKLQDNAAPFPAEQARREIELAFGTSVDRQFLAFEDQPLAAASIAQVHAATLPDGRRVAVKVRRPGIRNRIERDMRAAIRLLRLLAFFSRSARQFQPVRLAEQTRANLRKESDFRLEARAMNRLEKAFAGWPGVEMPAVIAPLVSESVLVQEMKTGRLLGDPSLTSEGHRLAETLVEFYLHQFFVVGVFHGDPHPGNLFFTDEGSICFHDFGLVGQLDRETRRELAMFIQAFAHQDANWMLDSAARLGLLETGESREAVVRGLEEILADYAGLPLRDWSLAELFVRVSHVGGPGSLQIPRNLLILMRALFELESAVRKLAPDLNVLELLQAKADGAILRFVEQDMTAGLPRLGYEFAFAARDIPASAAAAINRARHAGFRPQLNVRLAGLDEDAGRIEATGNRLAMSMVTLGLYIGSSLLMQHSIGPRLFGVPVLALAGYLLALWYTLRLARAIARSGHF